MNQLSRKMINTIFVTAFLAAFPIITHAAQITWTDIYSNDITATGNVAGTLPEPVFTSGITPFNPTLGTLTDIDIRIYGDIIYSGVAGSSYTVGAYGSVIPLPYLLDTTFSLDIDGFGGDFFSLGSEMKIKNQFAVTGLPGGSPIFGVTSFSFSFDYIDLLDQFIGPSSVSCSSCTAIIPPFTMAGGLDGFIDDGTLLDMMLFNYNLSFLGIGQGGIISPTTLSVHSNIFIDTTYIYTEPEPVPEPPAVLLILTGLIFMFRRRISMNIKRQIFPCTSI